MSGHNQSLKIKRQVAPYLSIISLLHIVLLVLSPGNALAQFDSGSTGEDGALDFSASAPGTVIDFDPVALGLDRDGDSVYHFTTITIPADVTVRLRADHAGSIPLHWLASGAVVIDGTLDLSGDDGHDDSAAAPRIPALPGPGGFAGGIGSRAPNTPPQVGFGPGGGCSGQDASNGRGSGAGYATPGFGATAECGLTYGNAFLLPLIGGSGGGGGGRTGANGSGGGAGGGALLLASSVSIRVDGAILARGGSGGPGILPGGAGSGGALRLVAPMLTGTGILNARSGGGAGDATGRIRLEALQNTFSGSVIGDTRAVTLAPNPVLLPTTPFPMLRIASIDGRAVPDNPRGAFDPVDVTIDAAQAVDIGLEAHNIPPGTEVMVTVVNETEGTMTVTSTPLAGTEALSMATANVMIPAGFSRLFSRAIWAP